MTQLQQIREYMRPYAHPGERPLDTIKRLMAVMVFDIDGDRGVLNAISKNEVIETLERELARVRAALKQQEVESE